MKLFFTFFKRCEMLHTPESFGKHIKVWAAVARSVGIGVWRALIMKNRLDILI